MGYTKKTLELLRGINLKGKTVVELGSQDLDIEIDYIDQYIKSLNAKNLNVQPYITKNYSRLSAKYLYDSLQVENYDCIDIDGEHHSFCFDLNQDLQKQYSFFNKYDIVTNFGTSEHVFNQYICFKNIHNMCKVNGLMIHSLPIKGNLNHAFFNYHPTFFEHLALKNDYTILYMDFKKLTYYKYQDSESIVVIFKKNSDKAFEAPIQNMINAPKRRVNNFRLDNIYNRFQKITNIDLSNINNIAIFGTGVAGTMAYNFASKLNKRIICFIDDYNTGKYEDTNIEIVDFNEYINKYQSSVDLILLGNKQKGDIRTRDNVNTDIVELSSLILSKTYLLDSNV